MTRSWFRNVESRNNRTSLSIEFDVVERKKKEKRKSGESAPTFDAQGLGRFEEGGDVLLLDVDLAAVHELEDGADLGVLDVLEDDDGVGTGVLQEQRLEVAGTGGQHHLVALDRRAVDGQRHVGEGLRLQQLLEHRQQVRPVVVPAQAELLPSSRAAHPAVLLRSGPLFCFVFFCKFPFPARKKKKTATRCRYSRCYQGRHPTNEGSILDRRVIPKPWRSTINEG